MTYRFNTDDYIIRVEFFGGLLINKHSMTKYQTSIYDALYLKGIEVGYNIDLLGECINQYFDVKYEPDLMWLMNNGILIIEQEHGLKNIKDINTCMDFIKQNYVYVKDNNYLRAPIELTIYPTFKCQMNCEFCFVRHGIKQCSSIKSAASWNQLIDSFVKEGVASISILGGEPTLYPEIIRIIRHIDRLGLRFTMTTNGYDMSEELVKEISNTKNLSLIFSLDSINREAYDGKLHTTDVKSIENLVDTFKMNNVPCRINTVYVGQAIDELKRIADLCNVHGIEKWSLALCYREEDSSIDDILDIKKVQEQLKQYIMEMEYAYSFSIEGCMLYSASDFDGRVVNTEYQIIQYGCECGNTILEIVPDGTMFACASYIGRQDYIGNAFDSNWMDIWNNSKILKELRTWKSSNKECKECDCYVFCKGGCPAYIDRCNEVNTKKDYDDRCLRHKKLLLQK